MHLKFEISGGTRKYQLMWFKCEGNVFSQEIIFHHMFEDLSFLIFLQSENIHKIELLNKSAH